MPDVLELWWVLPVTIAFSTVAIGSGVSGPMFFSTFFILVLGLEPARAVGAGLVTAIFGMGNGLRIYVRQGVVDYPTARALISGSLPGVVGGALLANALPARGLRIVFGVGLLFLGLAITFRPRRTADVGSMVGPARTVQARDGATFQIPVRALAPRRLLGIIGGTLTGIISAGLPELATTEQVVRGRVPPRVAVATSIFAMAFTAVAGGLTHAARAELPWDVLTWTIPGALVGSTIGGHVSRFLPTAVLERVLGLVFAAVGLLVAVLTLR